MKTLKLFSLLFACYSLLSCSKQDYDYSQPIVKGELTITNYPKAFTLDKYNSSVRFSYNNEFSINLLGEMGISNVWFRFDQQVGNNIDITDRLVYIGTFDFLEDPKLVSGHIKIVDYNAKYMTILFDNLVIGNSQIKSTFDGKITIPVK